MYTHALSYTRTHHTQELDEHQKETRGSFMVRVFGASGQPEIEVSRSLGWPNEETHEKLGFKCTYRGFFFLFPFFPFYFLFYWRWCTYR
jgi:hypothetical protein